jgi:Tfp pilus assembly protein PilN
MTVQVNLLPAKYRLKARRPRRLKLWLSLAGGMIALHVVSALGLRWMAEDTRKALHQAAQMQETRRALAKELASVSVEKRDLARQIALAIQLRRKHLWSEAFVELAAGMPDSVVLTGLTTDPPRDADSGKTPAPPKAAARLPRPASERDADGATARGLVIEGMAADHASVGAFLGTLTHRSRLGACELRSANRQPFLDDEAVAFTVCTKW